MALNSTAELGGKWRADCLNTRFPLPTLPVWDTAWIRFFLVLVYYLFCSNHGPKRLISLGPPQFTVRSYLCGWVFFPSTKNVYYVSTCMSQSDTSFIIFSYKLTFTKISHLCLLINIYQFNIKHVRNFPNMNSILPLYYYL